MSTLSTAISGLLAFQRALATTSHNIANSATPGYSRQVVDLSARLPFRTDSGFIGAGVDISGITRIHDNFLTQQVWSRSSAAEQMTAFEGLTSRISDLLADPNGSLSPALQDWFSAVQDMADNPSDIPSRQVVLSQANILVDRFHQLNAQFDVIRREAGEQAKSTVSDINSYAQAIAGLNARIVQTQNIGSVQANDLLDERDRVIEDLSKLVQVTTLEADNGAVNVFIGNGQTLVLNADAAKLSVQPDPYDAREVAIGITGAGGTTTYDITAQLTGGKLGGLLEFRDGLLSATQNDVGRVAAGLTAMVNNQHRLGMDLYNNLGGDFFSSLDSIAPEVISNRNNAGNGIISAQISDYTQLSNSDYILSYTGGNYTLQRLQDDTVTNLGAAPPNVVVDGVQFSLNSGVMLDGDSVLVRPLRNAARLMNVQLTTPQQIAAATPVRLNNTNIQLDGTVTITGVTDTTNAAFATAGSLSPPLTVRFLDSSTYEIVRTDTAAVLETGIPYSAPAGGDLFPTPGAYDPGYQIHMQGNFTAGDSFRVEYNTGGSNDNRNALLLDELRSAENMLNNTATLAEVYSRMVGRVGADAREAQLGAESRQALLAQATQQRESISGVNLDEEAANLVRYQQAYQAAAQVIAVSNTMFDSLIAAFR